MKKALFFSLFIISINSLVAQGDVQQFSIIHPKNPEIVFEKLVASDNSGFYALFNNKKLKSYCIEKFDLQGKSLYSTNFKGEPEFEQIGEKSLYIFSSEFDKDDGKKGKLYLTEINAENGAKAASKTISELEIYKKHDYEHFFSLSPDKTKLLVVSRFFCLSEELNEKATFRFFEVNGMKQILEKEIDSQVGDKFIKSSEYVANNEGDVFINFISGSDIMSVKQADAMLKYNGKGKSIAMVYAKEKKIEPINLELDKNIITTSFSAQMSNDNKLLLIGVVRDLVSNDERKAGKLCKGGILMMYIDVKSRKALNKVVTKYDAIIDEKLKSKEQGHAIVDKLLISKEHGSGDDIFEASNILEIDGDYYFIAHKIYRFSPTVYISSSLESKFLGDILVAKINHSTGVPEWIKVIPKSTYAKATAYKDHPAINYHVFIANDRLNFVYLDHPANFEKNKIEDDVFPDNIGAVQGVNKSNVVLVSFDQKGNPRRKIIFDNQENSVLPQMENIVINKKSLVLCLEDFAKKERRFGLITP